MRRCILTDGNSTYATCVVGSERQHHEVEVKPIRRFTAKVWPNRIQMFLDETKYMDAPYSPERTPRQITFGQLLPAPVPTAFGCRNVRVRRLAEDPPADPAESTEEKIAIHREAQSK